MPNRRKAPPPEAPSKAWLDSYADAMTLLLAFFVLLFAMSNLDVKKYEAFFEGLNGPIDNAGEGTLEGSVEEALPPPSPSPVTEVEDFNSATTTTTIPGGEECEDEELENELFRVTLEEAEALAQQLDDALSAHLDDSDYSIDLEQRGVVLRLADNALFASGEAALDEVAQDVLAVVADVLVGHPANDVEVEGHTDNRPTSTARFATNWELSSARATNVLRELLADAELEPARFAAVGRADTIPRGDNDTEEGRAENRRTEIVVLFPETVAATC